MTALITRCLPLSAWSLRGFWRWTWMAALLVLLQLAGCGGGASLDAPTAVDEPTGPGRVVAAQRLAVMTAAQVRQAVAPLVARGVPVAPLYDVALWRLQYLTTDGQGQTVTASALLGVPTKRTGQASPVLSYQHGTIFRDAEAPSNALLPSEPPVVMASLGYVVVAADYVGYGSTKGLPHPYLLSAPTAAAVVDALTASRTWRLRNGVAGNGQLFLVGYSEGGYATVAAHRALQAGTSLHRYELAGVYPGSGPYDLQATLDSLLDRVQDENPVLGALIDPGFLRHLGSTVRNEVRRALVRALLPNDADVSFDTRFIDAYLDDNRELIYTQSSVHDWAPAVRMRLFHGRDDQTVPYASGVSALTAMRARGAGDVTLTDCKTVPAGHLECVPDYWAFLLGGLSGQARDL